MQVIGFLRESGQNHVLELVAGQLEFALPSFNFQSAHSRMIGRRESKGETKPESVIVQFNSGQQLQ